MDKPSHWDTFLNYQIIFFQPNVRIRLYLTQNCVKTTQHFLECECATVIKLDNLLTKAGI